MEHFRMAWCYASINIGKLLWMCEQRMHIRIAYTAHAHGTVPPSPIRAHIRVRMHLQNYFSVYDNCVKGICIGQLLFYIYTLNAYTHTQTHLYTRRSLNLFYWDERKTARYWESRGILVANFPVDFFLICSLL